ncbi:MAG: hypothetical protein M3Y75_01750 [Actinomycetota bacterium]|nr:hypothetical protein [Actinomycetota bacterium]
MRRQLNRIALAALAASLAVLAGAGAASATILEVGGIAKKEKVEITASRTAGTSSVLSRTDGSLANTCTASHVNGSTESPYTGATVTAPLSNLSFTNCTRPVTVHNAGTLHVEHIAGTTDATVTSSLAEVTVGSPFGVLVCKTGTGVDIGRLTGVKEGHATIDINAVLNCGFLVPSASWKGSYTITSPTGFGVTKEEIPPATTLEIGGVKQGGEIKVNASLKSSASSTLARTDGSLANICIEAGVIGETISPYTGEMVTAPLGSLSFSSCTRPVTVHKAGTLHVQRIAGTTNGTVSSSDAEVTVESPFGALNCKTGTGTDLGTLTGSKEGHATIDVDAVLDCGFAVPSATWKATYTVTSPTGLGITE